VEQPVAALAHEVHALVVDEDVEQFRVRRELEPKRALGDDAHLQVHGC